MENDLELAGVVRTYLAEKATGSVTWVMEEFRGRKDGYQMDSLGNLHGKK